MSFAGHVFDMIRRIEANRALLKARHDKAAGQRIHYVGTEHGRPTSENPVPPERLAAVKQQIRVRARRERRKRVLAGCIVGAGAIGALIWLIHLYMNL